MFTIPSHGWLTLLYPHLSDLSPIFSWGFPAQTIKSHPFGGTGYQAQMRDVARMRVELLLAKPPGALDLGMLESSCHKTYSK